MPTYRGKTRTFDPYSHLADRLLRLLGLASLLILLAILLPAIAARLFPPRASTPAPLGESPRGEPIATSALLASATPPSSIVTFGFPAYNTYNLLPPVADPVAGRPAAPSPTPHRNPFLADILSLLLPPPGLTPSPTITPPRSPTPPPGPQALSVTNIHRIEQLAWWDWSPDGTLPAVDASLAFGPLALPGLPARLALAVGDQQGQVTLIDPQSTAVLQTLQVSPYPITALALHPDGKSLAVGTQEEGWINRVSIYDLSSGSLQHSWQVTLPEPPPTREIYSLAFSQDGLALAARTSPFGDIQAWELPSLAPMANPAGQTWYNANDLGASPDGHLISMEYIGEQYLIYDLHTHALLAALPFEDDLGMCQDLQMITTSSDHRYLALGCDRNFIPVWDLPARQIVFYLVGHSRASEGWWSGNITEVTFSPYGYLLVSVGYDRNIRFWDARTGELLLTFSVPTSDINDLAISPDGRYLASASADGALRLWGLPP